MKNQVNTSQETLENVVITDLTQILSITPEKASRIKSLRIENQIIDVETFFDFKKFLSSLGKINSLYFVKCQFPKNSSFPSELLRSVDSVPIIGIVNSNLSESSIEDIIWPIRDWLPVDTLDLTGNKIGDDSENFLKFLKNEICGVISIQNLILTGNDIPLNYQNKITELMKRRGFNVIY